MSTNATPGVSRQGRAVRRTRVVRKHPVAATRPNQPGSHGPTDWQSIEVRHLAALAAVTQEGSFRRAGEQLGYVQSAISGQIAHLEEAAGIRLLERASGTPLIRLTEAGGVLLRHTEEIVARFAAAFADLNSVTTRAADVVRVARLETFAPRRVAEILSMFRQRDPFARVLLHDAPRGDAARESLRDGTLDILIYEPRAVLEWITHTVLEHDEYVLLVSDNWGPIARSAPISAAEIAAARPIVPAAGAVSEALGRQLMELGIGPHPCLVSDSVAITQALVAKGLATALAPSRLVDHQYPGTTTIGLSHLLGPQTIALGMLAERTRSAALDGFARVLEDVCAGGPSAPPLPSRRSVAAGAPGRAQRRSPDTPMLALSQTPAPSF